MPLSKLMDQIGARAKACGLNADKLKSILDAELHVFDATAHWTWARMRRFTRELFIVSGSNAPAGIAIMFLYVAKLRIMDNLN